jgi:hypothetical protein
MAQTLVALCSFEPRRFEKMWARYPQLMGLGRWLAKPSCPVREFYLINSTGRAVNPAPRTLLGATWFRTFIALKTPSTC